MRWIPSTNSISAIARGGGTLGPSSGSAAIENTPTRFIAIELSEVDWLELRAIQPEPAAWMKQQIQQVLDRHREHRRLDRASTERLRWSERT